MSASRVQGAQTRVPTIRDAALDASGQHRGAASKGDGPRWSVI
ncbi:hypothetical protein [Microbacterium sp.]